MTALNEERKCLDVKFANSEKVVFEDCFLLKSTVETSQIEHGKRLLCHSLA